MLREVLWLGTLVLLVFALLVGLSVLRDIFTEGKERYRSGGKPGPDGPPSEPEEGNGRAAGGSESGVDRSAEPEGGRSAGGVGTTASGESVVCSSCNTRNDPAYTYCQECTERL